MTEAFNILVATDYSEVADNATKYAMQFAAFTNSNLIFCHIPDRAASISPDISTGEVTKINTTALELEELGQRAERLLSVVRIGKKGVKYRCKVGEGNVTNEILKLAESEAADFIILGTHGATAMNRTFLGSHSWEIIKKADMPVLAIPREAAFGRLKDVVFGTEYRPEELPIIKYLSVFASIFDAELTVLHIANNAFSPQFEHRLLEKFRNEVKSKLDYDKLSIRLINGNRTMDSLSEFCQSTSSSWLAMSHARTSSLIKLFNPSSSTKSMSFRTHVPLLAIPDHYMPGEAVPLEKHGLKLKELKRQS